MASSSLWTTYSMINGMCKGKFSCNLKQYCRVTSLIKSFDDDIKAKARVFSALDINKFVLDPEIIVPLLACEEGYCLSRLLRRSPTCRDHELENRDVRVYSSWCVCDPYASKAAKWQEKFKVKENFCLQKNNLKKNITQNSGGPSLTTFFM